MKYKGIEMNDISITGYSSPVTLITEQLASDIALRTDDIIWEAIANTGVEVDKYELIKAMQYDRNQYDKGYRNGYKAAYQILPWWARAIVRRRMRK